MTRMRIGKKKSTREEIGARNIDALGVETYGNEYLVYFLIQPDNIAVLSETAVKTKIMAMSSVIKGLDSIEFSCINSRENFDQNKMFYKERLEEEESPKVREILEKDLIHLDRVQIQTASAREFLFILRFRNYNPETNEVQTGISRMTNAVEGCRIFLPPGQVRRTSKDSMPSILCRTSRKFISMIMTARDL